MNDFRDKYNTNRDDIPLKEARTENSDDDDDDEEEKQVYPSSSKLAPILIGLCFQSFCIALVSFELLLRFHKLMWATYQDNTILSTAVPKITEQFNSLGDLSWYASAYLLTTCAVTLPFGKVYTYYSTKWTYMVALGLFEIGSLICAVTPTSKGLIFGRAIAGVGSGGLSPGALLIGSTSGIATITGPL